MKYPFCDVRFLKAPTFDADYWMVRVTLKRSLLARLFGKSKYRTQVVYGKPRHWEIPETGLVTDKNWVAALNAAACLQEQRIRDRSYNTTIEQGGPHVNRKLRTQYIQSGDHAEDVRMEREGKTGHGTPVYRIG